jgi:hypothetical protein
MAEEAQGEFKGSGKILRTLMTLVVNDSILVNAGSNQDIIIDRIPELFHAFYIPSAFCSDEPGGTPIDVIFEGPGIIALGGSPPGHLAGLSLNLFKRRVSGAGAAQQQEVHLFLSNPTSINANIAYEVYRIAGLL